MFQLGSLVVLCGLLIGTSDSLLGDLGNVVKDLDVGNVVKDLDVGNVVKDLDVGNVVKDLDVASTVGGHSLMTVLTDVLQNLDVGSLQKTTDWALAKNNILGALNALDLSKLNPFSSQNGYGLRINKLSFLNLQAEPSSNLQGINLKLPLVLDASVTLPIIGSMVDVSISLDLATSLGVQTDAKTGLPTLSIGQCSSDTDNISISLLGRRSTLVNRLLDGVSSLLTKSVSSLLQNQICPVIEFIFSHLNINLTQDLLSNLQLPVSL
ncbi:hypothetical protein ACRRTK_013431 [Alexandromys fortis]